MKLGGLDIENVKIGDTQVDKVYQGGDLVWQYVPPVPFEFTVKPTMLGYRHPLNLECPYNIYGIGYRRRLGEMVRQ
jgi:hypothetical protein